MSNISLFDGTIWYVVFLFSTTVHEASHALAALKLGDDTAHRGGQVTLDPTPHIKREPFGMVVVPIISYFLGGWMIGWASAPYDPVWAQRYPRRAAWMAMAGPASNLLLVLTAALLIRLGILIGMFEAPSTIGFTHVVSATREGLPYLAATLLSVFFSLNLLLCIFNMFPMPPLDGRCLPMLFLSDSASQKYSDFMNSPSLRMVGMIVAWRLFGFIYPPVQLFAVNLLYPGLQYG